MLNFLKANWIHLSYILLVGIIVWLVFGTQGFQDCICNQNNNYINHPSDKYLGIIISQLRNYMFCLWDALDRNHDAVIALFTIAIGIFTAFLFLDGRDKKRKELRAYLFITHVAVDKIRVGEIPTSCIQIKNSGLTPAYDVEHRGAMHAVKSVADLSLDKVKLSPRFNIGPGGTSFAENRFGGELSIKNMNELNAKQRIFYIYGKITYKDIFGKSHWTTYRTFQDGEGSTIGSNEVIICDEGNDCDKE